jgi:hypothetical protein
VPIVVGALAVAGLGAVGILKFLSLQKHPGVQRYDQLPTDPDDADGYGYGGDNVPPSSV